MTYRLSDLKQLKSGARICIYGAGGRGERLLRAIRRFREDVDVRFFVDGFRQGAFSGLPVLAPEALPECREGLDAVVVACFAEYQIVNRLRAMGVENLLLASQFFSTSICLPSAEAIRTPEYHRVLKALDRPEDREFFEAFTDIMRVTDSVRRAENAIYGMHFKGAPGYYEHVNREAVRHVLDIGMGTGNTSAQFCRAFPEARIYGFEPELENYEFGMFHEYLQGQERFTLVPLAVSDAETELRFSSSEKVQNRQTHGRIEAEGERVVRATTIDAFTTEQGLGPGGFIKVMVNGYEYPVLCGALETIRRHRPQIVIHQYSSLGMEESPAFRTMNFCVEALEDYRFRFSHWTASDKHTAFSCIPRELLD